MSEQLKNKAPRDEFLGEHQSMTRFIAYQALKSSKNISIKRRIANIFQHFFR